MQHYPGQRLSFQGDRCTVRYVGNLEGKDGLWLGVEWDHDQKGKHDGAVDGHRYFHCVSTSSVAGSFIRPSRKADEPHSFVEALKQKYALNEVANDAIQISGKTVEEVGFEKIQTHLRNFQQLTTVVLDGYCICVNQQLKTSQNNEIWNLKLRIRELDLSHNLFESWDDVLDICAALEHLRNLNVAGNRFLDTSISSTDIRNHQITWLIEGLNLADTFLLWEQIMNIVAGFPSLKILNASGNNIACILQPLRLSNIRSLDLSSNAIVALKDLAPLSELPHLEILSLRSNPVSEFLSGSPISFKSLHSLDLTSTKLPGLESLHPLLQVFPSLKNLQTKDTPLSKVNSATLNTIARLPNLTELNHSTVSAEERQNAELFYLGTIVKELEITSDETEEASILRNHPMWDALCRIYGAPTVQKVTTSFSDPNALEARITIFSFYLILSDRGAWHREQVRKSQVLKSEGIGAKVFQHNDPEGKERFPKQIDPPPPEASSASIQERSKSIPRTTSCYALQGIVGRLFDLPPPFTTTIRLFYETNEWDPVAGTDGDDDGWSVVSEDGDDDGDDDDDQKESAKQRKEEKEGGKRVLRTEELVPSTRLVGDWVTDKEARVKVVLV